MAEHVVSGDGTEQLWAVVCTKLHTSFGPFSSEEKATRFADRLSAYSAEAEAEGRSSGCSYVAITMWVQMAVVEKPDVPERLN